MRSITYGLYCDVILPTCCGPSAALATRQIAPQRESCAPFGANSEAQASLDIAAQYDSAIQNSVQSTVYVYSMYSWPREDNAPTRKTWRGILKH